jgi:hypothetical protein
LIKIVGNDLNRKCEHSKLDRNMETGRHTHGNMQNEDWNICTCEYVWMKKNKDKKEGQVAICADRNMFNKPGVTCNY